MKTVLYHKRMRRCMLIAVLVFSQFSFAINPISVYAEAPEDTRPRLLEPSIKEGAKRNNITFTMNVVDDHPKSASIEVLSHDDVSLTPRVFAENTDGSSKVSLIWKTTDENDGDYKVRYEAIDTFGNRAVETYGFTVANAQPLVTLNDKADERTIGGTVSRSDVAFHIKIDGKEQSLTPTVAREPDDDGTFIWTLLIPQDITDGAHTVDVYVTSILTEKVSDTVLAALTLTTPLKVSEPVIDTTPIPVVSLPEHVTEVGQFIAPSLPVVPHTQLYGVPTTDITENITAERRAVPPVQKVSATFSSDIQPQLYRDSQLVIATESGWMFFGIAWYRWGVTGLIFSGIVAGAVRSSKQVQAKKRFVGVESL